ncbi:MAG: SDR family NAD(P)-dependent oxidoreductase, partial [Candidatus Atribacteria bacterium]|nr:SDR family NAD(P)-dependent oxidoreductase [Candidatus Atribacteria bacterium]
MINFENQVALITGARRGIGFAIARTLGRYGAKVVVCDVASENDMKAALDVLHSEGIEVMAHI